MFDLVKVDRERGREGGKFNVSGDGNREEEGELLYSYTVLKNTSTFVY